VDALRLVRRDDLARGDDLLELAVEALDALAHRRGVDVRRGEHDLAGLARPLEEPVGVEQVGGRLAPGSRQPEVVDELAAERRAQHDERGQSADPADQDEPTVPVAAAGEAREHGGPPGHRDAARWIRPRMRALSQAAWGLGNASHPGRVM
jgi:hypothetical protein